MTSRSTAPAPAVTHASRTRYWVVVFAVTLAILSYIDRVCMSQAIPLISKDLGLGKEARGFILGMFAWGYALFEIPGGYLGDRLGPRRVLTRIVLWWSAFTTMTGWTWNMASLGVVQFLFGAGEAGGFPNLTKAFSIWLPQREKATAQSIMWTFARWGGAFTPLLVVAMLHHVTWRWAFTIFGSLGLIWASVFYFWFRDNPAEHPGVNEGERRLLAESAKLGGSHGPIEWGKLFGTPRVWLLWIQYFSLSYAWYFYITWLPSYLLERWHLTPEEEAKLATLPLLLGGCGALLAGFLLPKLARVTGSLARSRRIMACTGFLCAALLLMTTVQMKTAGSAMLLMGLASFFNDLVMPCAWATCMDIGGKNAGTISGSMNMMGNIAGFVAPALGGIILARTGNNWDVLLYVNAAVYLLGLACWPMMDPVTPLTSSDPAAA